jgi:hypothetical protein
VNQGGGSAIDGGRLVAAVGAVLLLVSLFLDWWGTGRVFSDDAVTAWTAFEIVDIILAALALAAIAAAIEPFVLRSSRVPERLGTAAAVTALVLVLVSIVNRPPLLHFANTELEVGAWLGLAGAALMCAGALLALNRVSVVVTRRDARPADSPAPPPPGATARAHETETQPLPPSPP